jgi:hypothetical protein
MVVLSESVAGALGKTQADFYVTVDVAAMNRTGSLAPPINQ